MPAKTAKKDIVAWLDEQPARGNGGLPCAICAHAQMRKEARIFRHHNATKPKKVSTLLLLERFRKDYGYTYQVGSLQKHLREHDLG